MTLWEGQYPLFFYRTMITPNWKKNSGKIKVTKGTCKGVLRARKQSLKALKLKLHNKP